MRGGLMIAVLIVVLAVTGVTTWLLIRTADAASDIENKAERIARNGRGINIATDSVIQLRRTNRIARSILDSVQPLDQQLARIVAEGRSIDATAGAIDTTAGNILGAASAINTTAGAIDTTAGAINGTAVRVEDVAGAIEGTATRIDVTAGGINTEAAQILRVAEQIDRDVRLINTNLNDSIAITRVIETDTTDILAQTDAAHQTAACLDERTGGESGFDGHCAVSDQPPGGPAPEEPPDDPPSRQPAPRAEG